jgi:hypothetical protein
MSTNLRGLHPKHEPAVLVRVPEGYLHGSIDEHYDLYIDLEFIDWDTRSVQVYTTLKLVP